MKLNKNEVNDIHMRKTNLKKCGHLPTRINSNALNIDKATGLKTPANVPSVRFDRSVSEIPNSTYPSDIEFELDDCVLFPTNAPKRRNKRIPAIGDDSVSGALMIFGFRSLVGLDVENILFFLSLFTYLYNRKKVFSMTTFMSLRLLSKQR